MVQIDFDYDLEEIVQMKTESTLGVEKFHGPARHARSPLIVGAITAKKSSLGLAGFLNSIHFQVVMPLLFPLDAAKRAIGKFDCG